MKMNELAADTAQEGRWKKKELVTEKHAHCDSIYTKGPQHIKQWYIVKVSTHMCKAIQKSEGMIDTNFKYSY